jgi:putative DNA primase/helicase
MKAADFDDLKARALAVPIASVALSHSIPIRGRYYRGSCLCGGTKRFWIDAHKGWWGCHDCTLKASDVIGLERFFTGAGFLEACLTLTNEKLERPQVPPIASKETINAKDARQHQKAKWLWDQRQPIKGTIAEKYWRKARVISCPLPATLGFLPAHKTEYHPALIAAVAMPAEIEPGVLAAPVLSEKTACVQLTLLKADGSGKAYTASEEVERKKRNFPGNKIFIGSPGSAPIVIAPANDLAGMAITEGVEDAASVHEATGLGAWASGGAWRMPAIAERVSIYHVECITVYAHPDEAGQRGAQECIDVLIDRGFEVLVDGMLSSIGDAIREKSSRHE